MQRLGQALVGGEDGCFRAVGRTGLVEDVSDVVTHRPAADEPFLGNIPVGLADARFTRKHD